MTLDNITAADIREVRKALVKCQELREMLARGESCGIDCSELKADCEDAYKFLTNINQVYGPQFPGKSV